MKNKVFTQKIDKMLTEIHNFTDDLERKVLRFGLFVNHVQFKYSEVIKNGIPSLDDLKNRDGFVVRPIEDNVSMNLASKDTDAGKYTDNSLNFDVLMQEINDQLAVSKYRHKKVILIVETTLYRYMIGNFEEPLKYTYSENIAKMSISVNGLSRYENLRQKLSPF